MMDTKSIPVHVVHVLTEVTKNKRLIERWRENVSEGQFN